MRKTLLFGLVLVSSSGCAMWDGLVELERRKNEWLFGPRTYYGSQPAQPAVVYPQNAALQAPPPVAPLASQPATSFAQ